MIKRVPRGTDTWEPFYGCRNWPDCKFTRGILPDGRIMPEVDPFSEDPAGALRWIMEAE